MNPTRYVDPSVLAGLQSCALAARYVCEGVIGGAHASLHSGYNAEFSHHREYLPGDDPRHIDWKRWGRTGKLYIRQYEENASLNAVILMDDSASMHFQGKEGLSKAVYSRYLAASLAYLLLRQRDGVGLATFADNVQDFIPPSSRATRFADICQVLDQPPRKGKTSLNSMLEELLPRIRKRCMFIVISDFLASEEEILNAAARLAHARHEILAFHVMSPEELQFPYQDFSRFEDMETQDWVELSGKAAKATYQKNLERFLREVRASILKYQADYLLMNTRIPLEMALTRFLHRRAGVA